MKVMIAGLLSFIVGFMCYVLTLKLVWNQSLGGDAYAVLLWGGTAFLLIAVPLYLFMLSLIDENFSKHKHFSYPLSCMLVYFVPTAFITLIFGGVSTLFSSEAILFHVLFLSSGLVFGVTSWFFRRKEIQNT